MQIINTPHNFRSYVSFTGFAFYIAVRCGLRGVSWPYFYYYLYALLPCLLEFSCLYYSDYICMTWITCMYVLCWQNGQIKTNSSSSSSSSSCGFDKQLYLTSCLNAHNHNTCIRLPQTGCTAHKIALFIISQDRQTQVQAGIAMATTIIID